MTEKRQEYLKAQKEKNERHERRLKRLGSAKGSGSTTTSNNQSTSPVARRRPMPGDESDRSSYRPHYRRNTSFPNRSTPDLGAPQPDYGSRYADDWYPSYGPPPRSQTLPKPPMGYDYDNRR